MQDISDLVRAGCPLDEARTGVLFAICEHTTAGRCVNEAEPGLMKDIEAWLQRIVPSAGSFAHNAVDDNADAHLRAVLLAHSGCVPVVQGRARARPVATNLVRGVGWSSEPAGLGEVGGRLP